MIPGIALTLAFKANQVKVNFLNITQSISNI